MFSENYVSILFFIDIYFILIYYILYVGAEVISPERTTYFINLIIFMFILVSMIFTR